MSNDSPRESSQKSPHGDKCTPCPSCGGDGQTFAHINHRDPKLHGFRWVACFTCDGAGYFTASQAASYEAGRKLRDDRITRGESLISEARRLGISPSELSKRERGKAAP